MNNFGVRFANGNYCNMADDRWAPLHTLRNYGKEGMGRRLDTRTASPREKAYTRKIRTIYRRRRGFAEILRYE